MSERGLLRFYGRKGLPACLHDLVAKPELNGTRGVLGDFDTASGRWVFHLTQNTDAAAPLRFKSRGGNPITVPHCLKVKPANLYTDHIAIHFQNHLMEEVWPQDFDMGTNIDEIAARLQIGMIVRDAEVLVHQQGSVRRGKAVTSPILFAYSREKPRHTPGELLEEIKGYVRSNRCVVPRGVGGEILEVFDKTAELASYVRAARPPNQDAVLLRDGTQQLLKMEGVSRLVEALRQGPRHHLFLVFCTPESRDVYQHLVAGLIQPEKWLQLQQQLMNSARGGREGGSPEQLQINNHLPTCVALIRNDFCVVTPCQTAKQGRRCIIDVACGGGSAECGICLQVINRIFKLIIQWSARTIPLLSCQCQKKTHLW